nr:MAG TPA: hypothetical protein [Caudoviricetes sp.]
MLYLILLRFPIHLFRQPSYAYCLESKKEHNLHIFHTTSLSKYHSLLLFYLLHHKIQKTILLHIPTYLYLYI